MVLQTDHLKQRPESIGFWHTLHKGCSAGRAAADCKVDTCNGVDADSDMEQRTLCCCEGQEHGKLEEGLCRRGDRAGRAF